MYNDWEEGWLRERGVVWTGMWVDVLSVGRFGCLDGSMSLLEEEKGGRMNETLLEVGKLVCAVKLWMSVVVAINGV